jgi:hypothetical protein
MRCGRQSLCSRRPGLVRSRSCELLNAVTTSICRAETLFNGDEPQCVGVGYTFGGIFEDARRYSYLGRGSGGLARRAVKYEPSRDGETATSGRTKKRPQALSTGTLCACGYSRLIKASISPGGTMGAPNGNDTFPLVLSCLVSPCRADDIRSRPPAAKRTREKREP